MRSVQNRVFVLTITMLGFVCVCLLPLLASAEQREFGRNPAHVDPDMIVIDTPPPPDRRVEAPEASGAWMTASPEEIDAAIAHMLAPTPRHHLMRDPMARMTLAESIVEASVEMDVPPMLVTVVMFRESTFDEKAIGKRGELGLMQVAKRNVRLYQCDMTTASGQVLCGVAMLRDGFDICGSWRGALTRYATTTGSCKSENPNVKRKVDMRLRDWQRLSLTVQAQLYEQGDEE